MNIDTIAMQVFIAVAETGSFTKAAERVGRTQSAVSQQIAKLENLLDKGLFIRGKSLSLTSEGEIFFSYAKKIFSMHREAIDRFKEPELQGEVRFGLPEDFASVYLSDVLIDFTRIHPLVMLNIECDLTMNLFERFKKKEFDLVLVKMNRPEDFPNGQEILSEPLEWVGNNEFISNEPLPVVLSPKPCVYRRSALEALEKKGIKWRLVFSSPSYTGTIAAVKAGMGITVLPKPMIPKELKIIKSKHLPKLQDTHVSILKHSSDNSVVNSFEDFVIGKLH